MTLDQLRTDAIRPALAILGLPEEPRALVQLGAIALQESRLMHRRQLVGSPPRPTGPAKSFWQGEQTGGMVYGVMNHAVTRIPVKALYRARGLGDSPTTRAVWDAIETDDVLAAGLARLLLRTDPRPLPKLGDVKGAWTCYEWNWRPGAPHPETWTEMYTRALEAYGL